jgi:hypothetical protein
MTEIDTQNETKCKVKEELEKEGGEGGGVFTI